MLRLEDLRGLGPKRIKALRDAGVDGAAAVPERLPKGYAYALEPTPIASLKPGEHCVEATVEGSPSLSYYAGRSLARASLQDGTGAVSAHWFNQPWMARNLKHGQKVLLYGKAQAYRGRLVLINPRLLQKKGVQPLYQSLPGLPGKVFSSLVSQVLEATRPEAMETLPAALRDRFGLAGRHEALRMAHFPLGRDEVARAQRRIAFENLLLFQTAVRQAAPGGQAGIRMDREGDGASGFWEALPFAPTGAQRRTLDAILADMASGLAMRRLVQGDVGSGKTAVALGAAAFAAGNGYQSALMAPTELLARQHALTAERLLAPLGISVGLLTGSLPASRRREALEGIRSGEWQLVVGTHALLGKSVRFSKLGLAITDEQHRFGVRQRRTLAELARGELAPHVLALSATPIPRSLALVLYGDLQVSVMDESPPGRKAVKTRIVPESKREELYRYLRERALLGEQSFLVCPLVEEDEEGEAKSAKAMYAQLAEGPLKGVGLALTYGTQPAAEREAALDAFYSGRAMVLVSTTVIEVGMDVPNATTMVVEDADRFGLAQLHQLRGRVGRGEKESWCFLLGEENERLETLVQTSDGFVIAQKDLELRGPGEFLGTRQHGRMLDAYGIGDTRLLEETGRCLEELQLGALGTDAYLEVLRQAEARFGQPGNARLD